MALTAPSPGRQRCLPPSSAWLSHNSVSTRRDVHQLAANIARPDHLQILPSPLETQQFRDVGNPTTGLQGPTVQGRSGGAGECCVQKL